MSKSSHAKFVVCLVLTFRATLGPRFKMAAAISIASELLGKMSLISSLKNFSYREYCQALIERDAVRLDDFGKLSISDQHNIKLRYSFTDGVFNPSHVIDYFARYTDKNCNELGELVIKNAKQKRTHWVHVASIVLPLKPMSFDEWCDIMSDRRVACDELFLFMLCELHNRHAVVFTNNRSWSTVHTNEPMTEDQIYAACDLHLIFLGQDVYGKLMLKPSAFERNQLLNQDVGKVITDPCVSEEGDLPNMENCEGLPPMEDAFEFLEQQMVF